MDALNLGCGNRFCIDWVNLDLVSNSPDVRICNVTDGIPFPNASFDFVYHSHLLEHLTKIQATSLLKECWRVLRPGGTIRVVVPDFEQIARLYLYALEQVGKNLSEWHANYDWILLEMYDQAVRTEPGGEIARFLTSVQVQNEDFIYQRWGALAKGLISVGRNRKTQDVAPAYSNGKAKSIFRFIRHPKLVREALIMRILGAEYSALQIGRFRLAGEVHQWIYDQYSLSELLKQVGFERPVRHTAFTSRINRWLSFNLDTDPDGSVVKPDSLFMEAVKPEV